MSAKSKMKNFNKIENDLPTLPSIITQIINLIFDEKSSVKDLSKIIKKDQALTFKVLKTVNSAVYGLQGKISTINHAIAILGFETLKNLLLSISIFDNFFEKNQNEYFDKFHFWCHSLAVAIVSRGIARFIQYPNLEEAYVGGLLHDIGKIIIEQIIPDEYGRYLNNLNMKPALSIHFEEENCSLNHALIGKMALEKWDLPSSLKEAIALHHGPGNTKEKIPDLASIISLADFICWTQGIGSFKLPSLPPIDPQAEKISLNNNFNLEPLLEEMKKELMLGVKIFNKDITKEELGKLLQKANLELGKINSFYHGIKNRQAKKIHELETLKNIIHKSRKFLDPSHLIQMILPEIHKSCIIRSELDGKSDLKWTLNPVGTGH